MRTNRGIHHKADSWDLKNRPSEAVMQKTENHQKQTSLKIQNIECIVPFKEISWGMRGLMFSSQRFGPEFLELTLNDKMYRIVQSNSKGAVTTWLPHSPTQFPSAIQTSILVSIFLSILQEYYSTNTICNTHLGTRSIFKANESTKHPLTYGHVYTV